MENDVLNPILHYGIIKERMAALATDALRAEILEAAGYKAQILEFIDMEHTPKNLLIRGVKKVYRNNLADKQKLELSEEKMLSYEKTREFLKIEPTLYQLLVNNQPLSTI
jgi:hypothetical protein